MCTAMPTCSWHVSLPVCMLKLLPERHSAPRRSKLIAALCPGRGTIKRLVQAVRAQ